MFEQSDWLGNKKTIIRFLHMKTDNSKVKETQSKCKIFLCRIYFWQNSKGD